MQLRRLSTFFTATGVIVGTIAVLGYAFDLVPALPVSVLKLVIYKLTFIGALGLVVFGALMGRLARTQEMRKPADSADVSPQSLVGEGMPGDLPEDVSGQKEGQVSDGD